MPCLDFFFFLRQNRTMRTREKEYSTDNVVRQKKREKKTELNAK